MAAFSSLTDRLSNAFKHLKSKGKLSEADIDGTIREIRRALLDADVALDVVRSFTGKVRERALGTEVSDALNPAQQVVKIVNEELTDVLGQGVDRPLNFAKNPPTIIMLAGLQGAGKTTMAGKLGAYCQKHFGKSPLLVACDVYRPAAIKQLQVVGEKLNLPVFEKGTQDPVITAQEAVEYAKRNMRDLVIVDTAGRLHIDSDMMAEIEKVRDAVNPAEILLVIDAMTGQDAVNAAKAFNDALELTGVIITKLDGDTRGGAALSVREVTGKPIKFCGNGEKLTDIEPFYPDRMASRILGMGDVMTLIEKAQESFDAKKAEELAKEDELILLCGHYEGVDQRIIDEWDMEEISIGDYILTGGELAAMVLIDSVSRFIPEVLGTKESATEESVYSGLLEYDQYTKPREYEGLAVPEVLLNGNHKLIHLWQYENSLRLTKERRPDLFAAYVEKAKDLTKDEKKILEEIVSKA